MRCSAEVKKILDKIQDVTTKVVFDAYVHQMTSLRFEELVDPATNRAVEAYCKGESPENPLASMDNAVLVSSGEIYSQAEAAEIFSKEPSMCARTGEELNSRIQLSLPNLQKAIRDLNGFKALKLQKAEPHPLLMPSPLEGTVAPAASSAVLPCIHYAPPGRFGGDVLALRTVVFRRTDAMGGEPRLTAADAAFAATVNALKINAEENTCSMEVKVSGNKVRMLFTNVKAEFSNLHAALHYKLPGGEIPLGSAGYGVDGWGRCWYCRDTDARLEIWFPTEGCLTDSELNALIGEILKPLGLSGGDIPARIGSSLASLGQRDYKTVIEPTSTSLASIWACVEAFLSATATLASEREVILNDKLRSGAPVGGVTHGGGAKFFGPPAVGGAGVPLTAAPVPRRPTIPAELAILTVPRGGLSALFAGRR